MEEDIIKEEVIIAIKISDISKIEEIPGFVPTYEYNLVDRIEMHQREWGKIETKEIDYKFFAFDPENLFYLMCAWNNEKKFNDHSENLIINDHICFVMYESVHNENVFQVIVGRLLNWVLNSNQTWPPNFKIYTGKHYGKDAVFCEFIPKGKVDART